MRAKKLFGLVVQFMAGIILFFGLVIPLITATLTIRDINLLTVEFYINGNVRLSHVTASEISVPTEPTYAEYLLVLAAALFVVNGLTSLRSISFLDRNHGTVSFLAGALFFVSVLLWLNALLSNNQEAFVFAFGDVFGLYAESNDAGLLLSVQRSYEGLAILSITAIIGSATGVLVNYEEDAMSDVIL